MQGTTRHRFHDDLSRIDKEKGAIAGRRIAMTLETSTLLWQEGALRAEWKGQEREQYNSKSTGANYKQKNKDSSKVRRASQDPAEQNSRKDTLREHHTRRTMTTLTSHHLQLY